MQSSSNPFQLGDTVQFVPNERAQGWSWFGPGTIQPNDVGVVCRIEDNAYLYIKRIGSGTDSSEVGGFHWECFRKVE